MSKNIIPIIKMLLQIVLSYLLLDIYQEWQFLIELLIDLFAEIIIPKIITIVTQLLLLRRSKKRHTK